MCKQHDINIAVNIVRYEPQGATETYDELLGIAEDIYHIDINRNNANQTKKTLKIGNGLIRTIGIMSNRKRKTPKLGLARRGTKKDIEITIFEEITELPHEKLERLVTQATGGAKINIKIRISNPWVLSMYYVKSVAKFLPFNEKILRDQGYQFKYKEYKSKKKARATLITNHRINTYLSEAQHQELYDL